AVGSEDGRHGWKEAGALNNGDGVIRAHSGSVDRRDFRSLRVWEKAHALTLAVYLESATFPKGEMFGVTSQMRRASASIPANIAEGCGRGGNELQRFCRIAQGSASELGYHLILARDLSYIADARFDELWNSLEEVQKMLARFVARLLEVAK
ncbi:MAG: four helix bundle protein, partial [Thermomicrobiales bacterium]